MSVPQPSAPPLVKLDTKPAGAGLPVFEVHTARKIYRIWADGRTEGFEDEDSECYVINRIPLLINQRAP